MSDERRKFVQFLAQQHRTDLFSFMHNSRGLICSVSCTTVEDWFVQYLAQQQRTDLFTFLHKSIGLICSLSCTTPLHSSRHVKASIPVEEANHVIEEEEVEEDAEILL